MDLITTIPNFTVSEVSQNKGLYETVQDEFSILVKGVFQDSRFNGLLSDLLNNYSDLDDDEIDQYLSDREAGGSEWEELFNFKDFAVTPNGFRGLTDGFWSWGVAFTYNREDGSLYIDDRVTNREGIKERIVLASTTISKFDSLVTKYTGSDSPNGLVITYDGEFVL